MPSPLPDGFVDTGLTFSGAYAGTIQVSPDPDSGINTPNGPGNADFEDACTAGVIGEWRLSGIVEFNSCVLPEEADVSAERMKVYLEGPFSDSPVVVAFDEVT